MTSEGLTLEVKLSTFALTSAAALSVSAAVRSPPLPLTLDLRSMVGNQVRELMSMGLRGITWGVERYKETGIGKGQISHERMKVAESRHGP